MKEFLKGMSLKKDWKVHLMCLILVLIADGIGKQPVGSGIMKITLLPMLYALVLGMVFAGLKIIKRDMMETASPYIGISVMFLTCRMAADIGPNLASVVRSRPAFDPAGDRQYLHRILCTAGSRFDL